jgi:hypothetical protein
MFQGYQKTLKNVPKIQPNQQHKNNPKIATKTPKMRNFKFLEPRRSEA